MKARIAGHTVRNPNTVESSMTTTQRDYLQKLSRRLDVIALAVGALGIDAQHQAVEELVLDLGHDLKKMVD